MSTLLDDDLRTAFAELAATTTISPDVRFGDIENRVAPSSRRRWPMLVAAAACVALVIGLAVAARDRTPDAPAPADTTVVPVDTPQFLFPEPGSDVRFDDPVAALDAYLADRMTTAPAGQTVTYEVTTTTPPFDGGEEQPMLGFSLTVTPDDPALCCDSGDGVAYLQLVDGAWFVRSAEIHAMQVTDLSYSDDGVVAGVFAPTIGGTYTITIDGPGWPGPDETSFVSEHEPDPDDPANGPAFRSPGHTAPAVAVRIWQSPSATTPYPRAMFAEFIVPRGTVNASNISLDPTTADTAPPQPAGSAMLSETYPTPLEAAEAYLGASTEATAEFVLAGVVLDVPTASVAPTGRWLTAAVDPNVVTTRDNEAWVRFELIGALSRTEGVVRLVDTGATAGSPAWAVSYAGTRGVAVSSVTYRDRLIRADIAATGSGQYLVGAHTPGSVSSSFGGYKFLTPSSTGSMFETGVGADAPSTVALTMWSTPDGEPAFAEVLLGDGGEHDPIDFAALLDVHFANRMSVPPLIGLTEAQARDTLERAGLTANVTYISVPAGDDRDGTAIEQDPFAGSLIGLGTAIEVSVAVAATP